METWFAIQNAKEIAGLCVIAVCGLMLVIIAVIIAVDGLVQRAKKRKRDKKEEE